QHHSKLFESLQAAEAFFRQGSAGYSPTGVKGELDGIELRVSHWSLAPLQVNHFHSTYFDDVFHTSLGRAEFDSAYLMQEVVHSWHSLPPLKGCEKSNSREHDQ